MTCYVCGLLIENAPKYIGKDKYRHSSCAPGSYMWMIFQSQLPANERSEFYEYFMEADK